VFSLSADTTTTISGGFVCLIPQKPTVVGGQPATFGLEAKFDSANLDKCLNDLFKLNGIFAGDRTGGYFLGSHNGQLFEVDFDTTSKDRTEISRIGQRGRTEHISAVGIAPRGGWTVHIESRIASLTQFLPFAGPKLRL
jgi:hypothetical protein